MCYRQSEQKMKLCDKYDQETKKVQLKEQEDFVKRSEHGNTCTKISTAVTSMAHFVSSRLTRATLLSKGFQWETIGVHQSGIFSLQGCHRPLLLRIWLQLGLQSR